MVQLGLYLAPTLQTPRRGRRLLSHDPDPPAWEPDGVVEIVSDCAGGTSLPKDEDKKGDIGAGDFYG